MKTLLKIIRTFFITLGVIFFTLLLTLAYLIIVDPFNLRPLFPYSRLYIGTVINAFAEQQGSQEQQHTDTENPSINLSADQEAALRSYGINPANLPTMLTPDLKDCFVNTLGQQRVDEIKNGATPNPIDLFKARPCLK